MPAAHRHRHLCSWIAILAALAFALVPTLARALAFAGGGWVEICTPLGIQQVSASGADEGPVQAGLQADRCAFCGLSTDATAPLPARPASLLLPQVGTEAAAPWLQTGHRRHAWRSVQARGPPAVHPWAAGLNV